MTGMPLGLLMSCRKVRISSNLAVTQSDELMRPDLQCRAEQAADTLKLALRTNHEGRATQERCSGRQHVPQFAALLDKANEIKKAFRVWLWCCIGHWVPVFFDDSDHHVTSLSESESVSPQSKMTIQ